MVFIILVDVVDVVRRFVVGLLWWDVLWSGRFVVGRFVVAAFC